MKNAYIAIHLRFVESALVIACTNLLFTTAVRNPPKMSLAYLFALLLALYHFIIDVKQSVMCICCSGVRLVN